MFCAAVDKKFSGVSGWVTQGNLTIFPFRYLIPHPRANNYTPRFEVYGVFIGYTLSVCPSVRPETFFVNTIYRKPLVKIS